MKRNKQSLYRKLFNYLEKKYNAPEECKLLMAEANLDTMIKVQPLLIVLGIIGLISILIKCKGHYSNYIPRFIYFGTYIIFGILIFIISLRLKKISFTRPFIKMIPTYFLLLYLCTFSMYILFYEKNTFNAMVVFACVAVNVPVFFSISPLIFGTIVTVCSIALMHFIFQEYSLFICLDSILFVFILYFHSLKRWATEKDNFIHHRSEHEYKENIENELRLAQVVQQSFFKHNETIYDDWAISYYNKPMAGVSGDFLDIYSNGNTLDGIGIFDVSGHGIASGLVTMLVKNIIFQEFNNGHDDKLKSILDRINIRYIKEKGNIENYLTGILTRMNESKVEFINAGHSMPIFYSAKEDSAYYIEDDNTAFGAIGLPDIPTNFVSHTVEMQRGDELIFFTDGATEATNTKGEDFGKDRLLKSIFRNADRPLTTQINCIVSDILTFIGNEPQKDDITIIILKKK
ncbi:MAG: serine/threonine-protein phosphatase [Treponema sp.]|nr:serine/threonine-protein phosphatase [Treponema sp.]